MGKIGFVIPWYGESDPDGIEMELHQLAAHLQQAGTDVEILTTCIQNAHSDRNVPYYAAGSSLVDDIPVLRFPVEQSDTALFTQVEKKLLSGRRLSTVEERTYIEESVYSPGLQDYLRGASRDYDFYVFLPYGFATTYFGMQLFPEKSILMPCFMDEPAMTLRLFRQTYVRARAMLYHTPWEMELAGHVYDFSTTAQFVMGMGVDTDIHADPMHFKETYGIRRPFLLYVGKKTAEKNVPLMLRYFAEYKSRHPRSVLQLVLLGAGNAEVPESVQEDVYDLGYVSDQDKYDAMAAAVALWQPSTHERFSGVLLESWLCGTPCIVSARCPVTRTMAKASNGGLYYRDYFEFEGSVEYYADHAEQRLALGENGKVYAESQYSWDVVTQRVQEFFKKVLEGEI